MDLHGLTRRISEYINDDDDDDIILLPPPPPPSLESHHFVDFRPFLILIICLISVSALVFTCIAVCKRLCSNSNTTQIGTNPETPDVVGGGGGVDDQREFLDENHGPVVDHPIWYIRTVGLPQSVIDSISVFKYKKDDGLSEETDCTICLNKFLEEETLRLLPKCSHAFHIPCIDTWLSSHQNCPLCRAPVVCNSTDNAQSSAVEPNSEQLEETHIANSEDSGGGGLRNESFDGLAREVTNGITVKNPLRNRVLSDISDHRIINIEEELQPMRRSVSLDASSASVIYREISSISQEECGGSSSSQVGEVKELNSKKGLNGASIARLMKSASFGYSLQKGPAAMKRSFSSFRRVSSRRGSLLSV